MCSWWIDVIHLFVVQILNREVEIYTRYICDTQVLKSCRSNMATLGHDVCDVHGASSLYKKTCWQGLDRVFPTGGMGESPPTNKKFAHLPPPHHIFIPSYRRSIQPNKNLFSCRHCSCTIFVLISYSFKAQIMLILILIDVQYSQNAEFSFEKFSIRQNHSSSGSHHLVKKTPSSAHYFLTQSQGNP